MFSLALFLKPSNNMQFCDSHPIVTKVNCGSAQVFQAFLAHCEETKSFYIDAMNLRKRDQFVFLDARRIITIDEDEDAIKNGGAGSVCF